METTTATTTIKSVAEAIEACLAYNEGHISEKEQAAIREGIAGTVVDHIDLKKGHGVRLHAVLVIGTPFGFFAAEAPRFKVVDGAGRTRYATLAKRFGQRTYPFAPVVL